jgi:SagB-type dehydrogenase family enzyme
MEEDSMNRSQIDEYRNFLKDDIRMMIDFRQTDQSRGKNPPPIETPYDAQKKCIDLIPIEDIKNIKSIDLTTAIANRKSHRIFKNTPLTLKEVSYLLWATQGIRQIVNPGSALRTVPSAGARHAFETYLCVLNVKEIEPGIYRYLPVDHKLLFEFTLKDLETRIVEATYGQSFTGKAPISFIWTTIPYRMEWRYHLAAHKVIAIDAGHVCQNLYLAVEAIGAGTCAIAAYNQEIMDRLLKLDPDEEFAIYMAVVGKI